MASDRDAVTSDGGAMTSDSGVLTPDRVAPTSDRIARAALIVALIGTALGVDPFADASFDAPKRLLLLLGVSAATAAWLWGSVSGSAVTSSLRVDRGRQSLPIASRAALVLAAASVAMIVISAIASPYPAVASPALRVMAIGALLLVLGASRLLDGAHAARFAAIAAALIAINALLSLLQAAGWKLPLSVTQIGGRFPTGALLGNEGYVALAAALMGAGCAAVALYARSAVSKAGVRNAAAAAIVIAVAAIVVNRQATAALALAAGIVVAFAYRFRLRWLVWGSAGLAAIMLVTIVVPAVRDTTWNAGNPAHPIERYQSLTTYRFGAWIAAVEMIGARPLAGGGPGSFAIESTERRLDAEIRLRERMVQPVTGTFVRAHNDYLQLAAESGSIALLLVLGALACTIAAALRPSAVSDSRVDAERAVLLAAIATIGVSALAWFPLQIPLTAMLALIACGRLWRLGAGVAGVDAQPRRASLPLRTGALAAVVALGVAAWPELPRYRAEWWLAGANARIDAMFRGRVPQPASPGVAAEADMLAVRASASLGDDPRPPMASGIARLIQRRPGPALEALTLARALGERPELTINIGRARGIAGDASGAHRAFVRTAWINPPAVSTLPSAIRRQVLEETAELEAQLVRGELTAPPPLD